VHPTAQTDHDSTFPEYSSWIISGKDWQNEVVYNCHYLSNTESTSLIQLHKVQHFLEIAYMSLHSAYILIMETFYTDPLFSQETKILHDRKN
jgi:hypothetical protein